MVDRRTLLIKQTSYPSIAIQVEMTTLQKMAFGYSLMP